MKIIIATTGRFHVLDLARELAALGHEVAFYSTVPRRRAIRFGLPAKAHRGLLLWLLPLVALQRLGGNKLSGIINPLLLNLADRLLAWRMEPCDVFIGMSGLCVESARVARSRYSARVYLERGSRHIESQQEILKALADRGIPTRLVPSYALQRELQGYALADKIVVPSFHAEESFRQKGIENTHLFRNPYGVDVQMFPPTKAPKGDVPTVLFVGIWSYQKGVDLLLAAWRKMKGVRLLHVGGVGDAPLPNDALFEHHDAVPQWKLTTYYQKAHLFVLPSRQEGMALVLSQALASGVPIVCSDRTGGEDLQRYLDDATWIKVVPHDDAEALFSAMKELLDRALTMSGDRNWLGRARENLTWKAYGERYSAELIRSEEERHKR